MATVSRTPTTRLPAITVGIPRPGRFGNQAGLRVLLLAAFCSFLFLYGIDAGDLWRTENLRAIIAAEFLRSGNWIVPTLYGEPLFTKPPGMYASIALASWPFGGVTTWSARLPSVLAATGTVLIMFSLFQRRLGGWAGLVAALIAPTSFMWLDKATTAEIDMLQVFWVAAAVACLLRALDETESACGGARALWGWWLAALLCVAGGILTKWTAAAFFYTTVIPLLWWRGRLRLLWQRHHLAAAAVGAAVCFAWVAAAVATTGWEVFWTTVHQEAMQRLSPGYHALARTVMIHHRNALPTWAEALLHPLVILAANLPWSGAALFTLSPRFFRLWDERGQRLLLALHCWTWPNVLFWSLVPEHAPRHSFPLFPGLAGLAAMAWIAWLTGRMRFPIPRLRPLHVLVGTLLVWLIVKVAFVEIVIPRRNFNREPRAKGELLATLVPPEATLYLFRLKDEGIMFYFGRPVRRLDSPAALPSSAKPVYCILEESEWRQWDPSLPAVLVHRMMDEQGAPIVLIKVST